MFFITSKALSFLFNPLVWIFFLLLLCLINKKRRKNILTITIVTFYIFTNGFIADEFARLWELPRIKTTKTYDVGIILGGLADYDNNTKSLNFNNRADRLLETEQLYYKGIIKKIMICGGNAEAFNTGYIEADAIKKHLVNKNIPQEDIIAENQSRNTKENAFNAALILEKACPGGDFLLITSAIHMRRSQLCFEKANIKVDVFPTDCTKSYRSSSLEYILLPRLEALEQWKRLIHEWIGYIVYKITF